MSLVATEVVVLHQFDYLESSRIIRFATRELGVQSVIARGAKRPTSRFGSSLDAFASGFAQYAARPGRELHNLTGFDLTRSRVALASCLERFSAAAAIAELVLAFGQGGRDDNLFDVLTASLDALSDTGKGRATDVGISSAWQIITALGFSPALDACAVCRRDIDEDSNIAFSLAAGGVVCARCRAIAPVSRTLPPRAWAALRCWTQGRHEDLDAADERRAHVRLLREFLQHHVGDGRELRALAAWEASLRRRA